MKILYYSYSPYYCIHYVILSENITWQALWDCNCDCISIQNWCFTWGIEFKFMINRKLFQLLRISDWNKCSWFSCVCVRASVGACVLVYPLTCLGFRPPAPSLHHKAVMVTTCCDFLMSVCEWVSAHTHVCIPKSEGAFPHVYDCSSPDWSASDPAKTWRRHRD